MSSSLRPQFFCTRPNGTLTPVVAVDELPAHISIRGVPRVLSPSDTQGMTSLGSVNPRNQTYAVDGVVPTASRPSSTGATNHRSRNHDMQSSLLKILTDENIPLNQRMALNTVLQQGLPQSWQVNNTSATGWPAPNSGATSPGGGSGQQSHFRNVKKEYCSYWIRHGECDYQQQGCLYKHEMPHDRSMLERLGLRDIPRWYREKHNIQSILPNGHGHPRPHAANSHSWKDDVALKSIQYPPRLGTSGAGEHPDFEESVKQKSATYIPPQQHQHRQQHQQANMHPGSSQIAFNPISSPTASFPRVQTQQNSPGQLNAGNKKVDLLSFDNSDYNPSNNLLYRPSNETSFEAPGKAHHEGLVRNLQSLTLAPGPANPDFLSGHFDSTVGAGRFKNTQRPRRLYQGNQDAAVDNDQEFTNTESSHAFHHQATASSSGASPISKTTGSQLASPVADGGRGSTTSEPLTREPSPTSLSSGPSPGIFRGRGKDKGHRKTFGAIGTRKPHGKRSMSDEDDMFFHAKK
ncbi:hypothetical protein BJX76DRAFT_365709 [Aspergillus varians]